MQHLLLADMGTPLMWFGCGQLLLGNLLIGRLESWILRRFLKEDPETGTVVLGNYVSMLVGLGAIVLLNLLFGALHLDPLRSFYWVLAIAWTVSFMLTVVIEAPFFGSAIQTGIRDKETWRSSLIANACSYAVIVPIAFLASPPTALLLHERWTPPMSTLRGWIYYADSTGHEVRRVRPDGTGVQFVMKLPKALRSRYDFVAVVPDNGLTRAQLLEIPGSAGERLITLQASIGKASQAGMPGSWHEGSALLEMPGGRLTFDTKNPAYAGFWAAEGLRTSDGWFALETPFESFAWTLPTTFANGVVLVQFGDFIYLVDPRARAAYQVALGRSPTFLRDP